MSAKPLCRSAMAEKTSKKRRTRCHRLSLKQTVRRVNMARATMSRGGEVQDIKGRIRGSDATLCSTRCGCNNRAREPFPLASVRYSVDNEYLVRTGQPLGCVTMIDPFGPLASIGALLLPDSRVILQAIQVQYAEQ